MKVNSLGFMPFYELPDAAQTGPANLHDRNLDCHQKLWAIMENAGSREWQEVADPAQPLPSEDPERMQLAKALATGGGHWEYRRRGGCARP